MKTPKFLRSLLHGALGAASVIAVLTASAFAQPATGVIRGEITDDSGGVLPGVTVGVLAPDGQPITTITTDSVGRFVIGRLPLGTVKVVFELDGFEPAAVTVNLQAGVETQIAERMKLARMTEQVIVVGTAPPEPPAAPPLPRYEPPPPPVVVPIPAVELETVCKPAKPSDESFTLGTIQEHRYAHGRTLYSKGDELIISGGTRNGLQAGRNFVVRRNFRVNSRSEEIPELGEHTAGIVQILRADDRISTAVVVHTCTELMQGDVLAAFMPERASPIEPVGPPNFDEAARVLFADPDQLMGVTRRLMVIDRGTDHGLRAGQRVTLFRRNANTTFPFTVGEAVVISVRNDSSTIRILNATDAIQFGDFAAPQHSSR